MATQIPYKKRNEYLIWGTGVFLIVVYLFALRPTLDMYQEVSALATPLEGLEETPKDLPLLEEKNLLLEQRLSGFLALDSMGNQGPLLQVLSSYCTSNRILLKEFPEALGHKENQFHIKTIATAAQGGFIPLVKLAFVLERSPNVGRLSALHFQKEMDYKTRKEILVARYYLQTLENKP